MPRRCAAVAQATGPTTVLILDNLGLFGDAPLPKGSGSPADILQALLEERWALQPGTLT